MALPATQTFTGINYGYLEVLVSEWSVAITSNGIFLDYPSDRGARPWVASTWSAAYWNDDTFSDDQYAEANLNYLINYRSTGAGVRLSASGSGSGYIAVTDSSITGQALYRINGQTTTQLGSSGSDTVSIGDDIRIEANGTTISAELIGGTWSTSGTDATYSSGSAGIAGHGESGTGVNTWEGGDLSSGTTVTAGDADAATDTDGGTAQLAPTLAAGDADTSTDTDGGTAQLAPTLAAGTVASKADTDGGTAQLAPTLAAGEADAATDTDGGTAQLAPTLAAGEADAAADTDGGDAILGGGVTTTAGNADAAADTDGGAASFGSTHTAGNADAAADTDGSEAQLAPTLAAGEADVAADTDGSEAQLAPTLAAGEADVAADTDGGTAVLVGGITAVAGDTDAAADTDGGTAQLAPTLAAGDADASVDTEGGEGDESMIVTAGDANASADTEGAIWVVTAGDADAATDTDGGTAQLAPTLAAGEADAKLTSSQAGAFLATALAQQVLNLDVDESTLGTVHALIHGSYTAPDVIFDDLALVTGTGFQFHGLEEMAAYTPAATSLPVTVGSGVTQASFVSDSLLGVVLDTVDDTSGAGHSMDVCEDVSSIDPTYDRRLWRLDGQVLAEVLDKEDVETREFSVGPRNAKEFRALPVVSFSGASGYIFEWRGVSIPHSLDGDTLWVRIACVEPATGDHLEWAGWFGRERGRSARITYFGYPYLVIRSPQVAGGGETNLQASARSRLLVPMNEQNTMPLDHTNMAWRLLAELNSPEARIKSPGSVWQMPFAAVCAGGNVDANNQGRTLQIQARDPIGWSKQLRFRLVSAANVAYCALCPDQLPPWEGAHAHGDQEPGIDGNLLMPENEWGVSFAPRYAIEMHAYQAASNHFWYDVCERYRDSYEAAVSPTPVRSNASLSTFGKGPSILLATINFSIDQKQDYLLGRLQELAEVYRLGHLNSYVSLTNRLVAHWQIWQTSDVDVEHCKPDFSDVPNDLAESILRLRSKGWRSSLYTRPQDDQYDRGWIRRMRGTVWPWFRIDGSAFIYNNGRGYNFDRRIVSLPAAMVYDVQAPIVSRFRLGAIYHDIFTGGTNLYYSGQARGEGGRVASAHGGKAAVLRKNETIALQRLMGLSSSFPTFPGTPDDHFVVLHEGSEEGRMADWHGGGYDMVPEHCQQAESAFYSNVLGFTPAEYTDYPIEFRHLNPPLWQCVHNAWQPTNRFSVTPLLDILDTHPDQPPGFGLTASEWLDYTCLGWSLLRIQGICNFFFSHQVHQVTPVAQINADKKTLEARSSVDPTGVGLSWLQFSKHLFEMMDDSAAGTWLLDGTMERPLDVDFSSAQVGNTPNPVQHALGVYGRNNEIVRNLETTWFIYKQNGYGTGELNFDVVDVLHSVWKNPSGEIAVVLINWTSVAADWEGTVTPSRYGLAGTVTVERMNLGGSPTTLGSSAAASFTMRSAAASGGDVYLGQIPARTMWVLRLS